MIYQSRFSIAMLMLVRVFLMLLIRSLIALKKGQKFGVDILNPVDIVDLPILIRRGDVKFYNLFKKSPVRVLAAAKLGVLQVN